MPLFFSTPSEGKGNMGKNTAKWSLGVMAAPWLASGVALVAGAISPAAATVAGVVVAASVGKAKQKHRPSASRTVQKAARAAQRRTGATSGRSSRLGLGAGTRGGSSAGQGRKSSLGLPSGRKGAASKGTSGGGKLPRLGGSQRHGSSGPASGRKGAASKGSPSGSRGGSRSLVGAGASRSGRSAGGSSGNGGKPRLGGSQGHRAGSRGVGGGSTSPRTGRTSGKTGSGLGKLAGKPGTGGGSRTGKARTIAASTPRSRGGSRPSGFTRAGKALTGSGKGSTSRGGSGSKRAGSGLLPSLGKSKAGSSKRSGGFGKLTSAKRLGSAVKSRPSTTRGKTAGGKASTGAKPGSGKGSGGRAGKSGLGKLGMGRTSNGGGKAGASKGMLGKLTRSGKAGASSGKSSTGKTGKTSLPRLGKSSRASGASGKTAGRGLGKLGGLRKHGASAGAGKSTGGARLLPGSGTGKGKALASKVGKTGRKGTRQAAKRARAFKAMARQRRQTGRRIDNIRSTANRPRSGVFARMSKAAEWVASRKPKNAFTQGVQGFLVLSLRGVGALIAAPRFILSRLRRGGLRAAGALGLGRALTLATLPRDVTDPAASQSSPASKPLDTGAVPTQPAMEVPAVRTNMAAIAEAIEEAPGQDDYTGIAVQQWMADAVRVAQALSTRTSNDAQAISENLLHLDSGEGVEQLAKAFDLASQALGEVYDGWSKVHQERLDAQANPTPQSQNWESSAVQD